MQARSTIILLGILKPVSHFKMDKKGGKNLLTGYWASTVNNVWLSIMMLIPFHSQTMANRSSIRKQWKKEQCIFLFIMVLGQKQVCHQEKGPLAWPKDAVTGTAASARLLPQVQCPHYGLEKSPVPLFCLTALLWRQKTPHNCWRIFASLTLKEKLTWTHNPVFQNPTVPL